jgi:2,3-bisphosphoglycerate-independent phosphoglycerate mutase
MTKKVALIILDGWGIGNGSKSDAIANSRTPFMNSLYEHYPHSKLKTFGENVGLPDGQMGNSEVGHLNIGAGRVVYQDLEKINKDVRENKIDSNEEILKVIEYVKKGNKALHLMGLVSDGGVHSHQLHLHKLCDIAVKNGLQKIYIHAFTDGRDTDPKSGLGFLTKLQAHINDTPVKIASVIGRYYAMDRDQRWERVKLAYDLLVNGKGKTTTNALKAIENAYTENITDEFIKPIVVCNNYEPIATIKSGDAVICFNFRTDRCREITEVLTQKAFPEQEMTPLDLYYTTMTKYDDTFKNVHVIYSKDNLLNTLGEVLAAAGKKQIRIAETEKYPHVTFFFSGGREQVFENEKRIMIPSPKVATYDLQPEMSAKELTEAIQPELEKGEADFICLNFANPDMVGHTGVYEAVVKAVETVDACLKRIVEKGIQNGYSFIVIADHGNADYMLNDDGSVNTAHSTNLVPCVLLDSTHKALKDGKLADIAPTILNLMEVAIPIEMTGTILV